LKPLQNKCARRRNIDPSPLSPFLNVLVVGLGYHLGTEWVAEALRMDPVAAEAAEGRTLQFLGNLDPIDFISRRKFQSIRNIGDCYW
jgi:hypothetical protein